MYAQATHIRVPMGMMPTLRRLVEEKFLPKVQLRPGFITAYLLEQEDDVDQAELVLLWENQAAAEDFAQTGSLEATPQMLVAALPGTRVQRQGYRITVQLSASELAPHA
ncbi:MAG: hypothetical protein IAE80_08105 [Anaerolinea sp.]|nr:hypothetical protein [Anaerolinea sp.]